MRFPVERVFLSEAARVGVGTYAPHDPTTADIADLVGSVDLSKVARSATRAIRAHGPGPARSMPRAAACSGDDRDPEGQARVPLPAADPDPGEERQGVALPADPSGRDHRRAHQPGRVQAFLQEKENEALLDRMVIVKVPYTLSIATRRASTASWFPARRLSAVHLDPHVLDLAAVFAILTRLALRSARAWT
jgi:serine protein kinase